MSTKSVLIVEDDIGIRDLLEDILTEEVKCSVSVASDGYAALLLLHKTVPDLFLLDYRLPGEINGAELICRIRAIKVFQETPIILMSACFFWEYPSVLGVRFLRKPFELDRFLQIVQEEIGV